MYSTYQNNFTPFSGALSEKAVKGSFWQRYTLEILKATKVKTFGYFWTLSVNFKHIFTDICVEHCVEHCAFILDA